MEDMRDDRGREDVISKRQARGVALYEWHRPIELADQDVQHRPGQVYADDVDRTRVQGDCDASCADADLEDAALAGKLGGKDLRDTSRHPGWQPTRGVIERSGAIEPDGHSCAVVAAACMAVRRSGRCVQKAGRATAFC